MSFKVQNYLPAGKPWDMWLSVLNARKRLGYWPDVKSPKTFNEHILAQKRDFGPNLDLARELTDKARVKDWLMRNGYADLVIPTILVTDDPEEVAALPIDRDMVIKATHGSGDVIIKRAGDPPFGPEDIKRMRAWLKEDYYRRSRELSYKGLEHRIIVEEMLSGADGEVPWDFKIGCFQGEPFVIQVDMDRYSDHTRQLFTPDWALLDFCTTYPRKEGMVVPRPETLDYILQLARNLTKPFRFCRIDLYILPDNSVKLGEFTFYPANGCEIFVPASGDLACGRMMHDASKENQVSVGQ